MERTNEIGTFNVEHVDNRRRCLGHKPDLNWLQIEAELGRNLLKISGKLIARPLSGLDTAASTHAHLLLLPLKFHQWRPRGGRPKSAMQRGIDTLYIKLWSFLSFEGFKPELLAVKVG